MKNHIKQVSIVDYGIGNLLSVYRGVQKCGYEPILVDSKYGIENAKHAVKGIRKAL